MQIKEESPSPKSDTQKLKQVAEKRESPQKVTKIPRTSNTSSNRCAKTQRHKTSAARCRERLHSLLETLWDTVPETERQRLASKDQGRVGTDIPRAEKVAIVVAYIQKMKADLRAH